MRVPGVRVTRDDRADRERVYAEPGADVAQRERPRGVVGREPLVGLAYDPPERLARKVVDRLFPWAPPDTDGWTALRWANGRLPLPGQPEIRPNWSWQCAPLDEWEGDIRFHRRHPPRSFVWDADAGRWRPVP